MLWRGALDALRLPGERISSRWLGTEALMLAAAPYKSTKELVEDLQLATVKRLLPNVDKLADDEALANAVLDIREVYEDTVYQVVMMSSTSTTCWPCITASETSAIRPPMRWAR